MTGTKIKVLEVRNKESRGLESLGLVGVIKTMEQGHALRIHFEDNLFLKTSKIIAIEKKPKMITVWTNNTIYVLGVID